MGTGGHFDEVIEKINEMIAQLKDEGGEDIKSRDDCKKNYHENAQEKAEIQWHIKKNEAAIVKIESIITEVEDAITATEEEITETKKQLGKMLSERTDENDEFKAAKKDDEAAIGLLEQAIEALSGYYKDNKIEMGPIQGSGGGFLQEPEFDKGDQPPDASFQKKGHKKNESKGIISILTMITEDLGDEIKNGIKNEASAQAEYEKQRDAANKLIDSLETKKINLDQDLAKQTEAKEDEEGTLKENKEELTSNEEYRKGIEPDCDWMLENFEERVKKRTVEMNGLVSAKEFLAGAGFLQK